MEILQSINRQLNEENTQMQAQRIHNLNHIRELEAQTRTLSAKLAKESNRVLDEEKEIQLKKILGNPNG